MDHAIRAVVAVEGLDAFDVQRALPDDANFALLAMTEGVDETIRAIAKDQPDLLVVACQGREDDRTLHIIDGAHRAAPDVPIIVLAATSPNGFLRRAFEAGAADMAIFPQTKEQLRLAMSVAVARRPGHGVEDRARAGGEEGARHRPRPAVRRRRALPRASAREDDVRPCDLARRPRRGEAQGLRDDA